MPEIIKYRKSEHCICWAVENLEKYPKGFIIKIKT